MSNESKPQKEAASLWQKTATQNLIRNSSSGVFYARFRLGGKLVWRSLETTTLTVARLKLPDVIKRERTLQAAGDGQITFAQSVKIYRERVAGDPDLKPKSKVDHEQRMVRLLKVVAGGRRDVTALPGVAREERARFQAEDRKRREEAWRVWGDKTKLRAISKEDCMVWARKMREAYGGASTYNKTISTLRAVLDIGIEHGARFDNPAKAKGVTFRTPTPKALRLPEPEQFEKFIAAIELAGSGWSKPCADLVRFLAFTGLRTGEARFVTWADVNFATGEILVRGNPETGLKCRAVGEARAVPLIPDARALVERLRAERADEDDTTPIMPVHECQRAMDRAAAEVGMARIAHHDLRHLFATRCIESGVDIPTVSRWLGHKDGGALAMRTYGHLRREHSVAMAQRVTFTTAKAKNIVPMGSEVAA